MAGQRVRFGWWYEAVLLGVVVGVTAALATGHLGGLDLAVRDWCAAHRGAVAVGVARAFNLLGQGGPLTLIAVGLAGWLAGRRRSVRPLLPVAFVFGALYLTIGPLKLWSGRPYPREAVDPHPELFFRAVEHDRAFPSGHTANAVVWLGVIVLLAGALRRAYGRASVAPRAVAVLRVAAPVIVVATTVYLQYHWLTDSIVGLAIGLLLDRLRQRVPWDRVPLPGVPERWRRPALD
ncbi:hypothetical protein GCM10010123_20980 [Pilimelia anulata]|uniref:Phosphatidic acid phosphatase type 2/haloperoxidase domain-containing protein n=1 Tax=Pilimelia anulata TaxID=53371 RepID=A0A8J3B9Y8_9ACTN|nr:phosphatase PAP2 family protein [Pilimelia anulata]GGJ90929.1 hypothetical protein GCM10010123_20980 [Pilimelia anulata]